MKYKIILLILLIMALCCGCGDAGNDETMVTSELLSEETLVESVVSETEQPEYSWDNTTIFCYGDTEYDLQELEQGVSAIMWCKKVGKYVVINGHVGPHNGHYFIFNTETKEFEKILSGSGLVWHSDDITTGVYTFWNGIYTYDGELVAKCEIEQFDHIRSIEFIEDNTKIKVEISPNYGEEYTVMFALPEE